MVEDPLQPLVPVVAEVGEEHGDGTHPVGFQSTDDRGHVVGVLVDVYVPRYHDPRTHPPLREGLHVLLDGDVVGEIGVEDAVLPPRDGCRGEGVGELQHVGGVP